jgi:hypothetical protein
MAESGSGSDEPSASSDDEGWVLESSDEDAVFAESVEDAATKERHLRQASAAAARAQASTRAEGPWRTAQVARWYRVTSQRQSGSWDLTPLQAAELRLTLAKLGQWRLGDAALGQLGAYTDVDVLRIVAAGVTPTMSEELAVQVAEAAAEAAANIAMLAAEAAADPVFAGASSCPEMLRWLADSNGGGDVPPQCELLFRASRDGWDCQAFHRHCDNKGATLTVIRERSQGYVFGGYTDAPWLRAVHTAANSTTPLPVGSDGAFLFALRCHAGLGSTRMRKQRLRALSSVPTFHGPTFHCPTFGNGELRLGTTMGRDTNDGSATHVGWRETGEIYACPAGQNGGTMLTGAREFQAGEVEIFRVEIAAVRAARLQAEAEEAANIAMLAAEAAADPVFAGASSCPEMLRWLADSNGGGDVPPQCELLFRASRDGWDSQAFHRHCDNKGATLTVIRERSQGYVFGGYTDVPWRPTDHFFPPPAPAPAGPGPSRDSSFLFALRCHAGLGPTRMGRARGAAAGTAAGAQRILVIRWLRFQATTGALDNGGLGFGLGGTPLRAELGLGATLGRDADDGSVTHIGLHGVYMCPVGQDGGTVLIGPHDGDTGGFQTAEIEVYRVHHEPEGSEPEPERRPSSA